MCYDEAKNQEKINEIINQAGPERSKNWFNGSTIEMFRNAVLEFPNNYDLLFCLAKSLCFSKEPYVNYSKEERQKNLQESISICTRILGDCTDDNLRLCSLKVLAHAYIDLGQKEKAIDMANKLPLASESRNMVLPKILDGAEKYQQIVKNMWMLSDMFE